MTGTNYFAGEGRKTRKRGEEKKGLLSLVLYVVPLVLKCGICECPKTGCCPYSGAGVFSIQCL